MNIEHPQPTTVDFQQSLLPVPCTTHKCANGHSWAAVLRVAACPGCGSAMLALMMVNCPVCNEPTSTTAIRLDHLPQGGQVLPLCKGSATLAEAKQIVIEHTHAADEQEAKNERVMISKPHANTNNDTNTGSAAGGAAL